MVEQAADPGPVVALLTVGAAVVVVAAAGTTLPDPDRRTVLAATPWMVTGGLLHALAASGAYRGPVAEVFGTILGVPGTVILAGLLWLPLAGVGRLRDRFDPAGYLAATGTGAGVLPSVAVLLQGTVSPATVTSVLVVPLVAGLATGAVVLALGLGGATALAETRSLGLLAIYGQAFDAVAVAVAVDALGAPARGPLVGALVDLGGSLGVADLIGTAWPVVFLSLAGSGLLVVAAARTLEAYEVETYVALGAVGALGLGPGLSRLLVAALL